MRLIFPDRKYMRSYVDACEEYRANGVDPRAFLYGDGCDVFKLFHNYRTGTNLPANRVGATYLWLVDGGEFVGEISIRHKLTEALLRYGGHIGYAVRHSRWNQGAGTAMLAQALGFARANFDFERVLITCDDDNVGSARVIEKNGGVLQDKVRNTIDGKEVVTRRYWVEI